MVMINSALMTEFQKKSRIRTAEYRGTINSTIVKFPLFKMVGNVVTQLAVNDVIALTLIPYRASIRSLRFKQSLTNGMGIGPVTAGAFSIGMYGVQSDGVSIGNLIDPDAVNVVMGPFGAAGKPTSPQEILWTACLGGTIYEKLGAYDPNNPNKFTEIAAFEPYKNDRFGILALTVSADLVGATEYSEGSMIIDYVEPSPSDMPILKNIGLRPLAV